MPMAIDRRTLLRSAALGLAALGLIVTTLGPRPAAALAKDAAASFVEETIQEVAELVQNPGTAAEKADRLRAIMERRGAMHEISRFVAGTAWRQMDEAQQKRFVDVFTGYVSAIYARRFNEYAGEAEEVSDNGLFRLGEVVDAGKKGMLVKTSINRANDAPIIVEWLVTDRPGKTVIADIVIEGVSLLVTQREEVGAMLEARGGSIDKLIDHLGSA